MITDLEDARAQRAVRMIDSKLPAGCDYQGRHFPRPFADTIPVDPPQPAEACTEIGADGCDLAGVRLGAVIVITTGVPFVLALISWVVSMLPAGAALP